MVFGCATLQEVETYYSINDLADVNEALDLRFQLEHPTPEGR